MASQYPASNISAPLSVPPNKAARLTIWESFFGPPPSPNNVVNPTTYEELSAGYFQSLYKNELEKLMRGYKEQNWDLAHLSVKTHQDILHVVKVLEAKKTEPKAQVLSDLKANFAHTNDKQVEDSIDLAVRIRFMINTRNPKENAGSQAEPFKWKLDQTLQNFLRSRFPRATWKPEGKKSRLSPLFRAAYMVDVCGLELEETSCLHNHLQLYRDGKKNILRYFPYKSCLHALESATTDPIIPRKVIKETIKSLNLLFPMKDPATDALLLRRGQKFHRDEPFGTLRTLNVLEFDVWRDRLLELYEEVFLSPPASWAQLYRDRRNPQQFWTFWIALVILVLTIVSTVAGVVQTVYSALAYHTG